MEDEAADIELLEQHLNKSTLLSTRMTSILSKFDSRLVKLEKSILPLHRSTQSLTKVVDNIDKTLQSIDKVASNHESVAAEESLILRGPSTSDLITYTDAMERLNANIAFKGGDRSTQETAHLIETGAKKLAQLFTKLVAEASSTPPLDPVDYLPSPPNQIPTIALQTLEFLEPLVSALRSLPLPSTHPSHPASTSIYNTLQEAQRGYADMRSAWAKRCLENGSKRAITRAETDESTAESGRQIGEWVEGLLALSEAEHATLVRIAPLYTPQALSSLFATYTTPLVTLVMSTLSSLQNLIKRSLRKYVFLAFSVYTELSALQGRWDDIMRQRAGRKQNELAEGLHSMRAVCLRSFPELIADIKLAAMPPAPQGGKPVEIGTGTASITLTTVEFLAKLPYVQDAVSSALQTLGDGNWNMGDATGNMRRVGETNESDERTVLEHFTYDVVSNLLNTITALSKTQKRLPLSAIFLLNNIGYLRLHLLEAPETPIDDLLSAKSQSLLNATYRTAKATYFETNFMVLVSCLSEDKAQSGLGSSKQSIKEKALRFFDCLEDVLERHRFAKLLVDDKDGRERLADDAIKLVIPSLKSFLAKHREKEFSRNPAKYIKASPEDVERQLRSCY